MNILLAEDINYVLETFESRLGNVPQSSTLTITNRNYMESLQLLKSSPVLTKQWYCKLSDRLTIEEISKIMSYDNLNVLRVRNKSKYEELKLKLGERGIKFKALNNLQPSKEDITAYVSKQLKVDYNLAKYICNRHRYYLPKVISSVNILGTLDKITKNDVKNYTDSYNFVSIHSITEHLLGIGDYNSKRVIDCVYQFRFAFDYILKTIIADLEMYKVVFEEISNGELTLSNYEDYISQSKQFNKSHNFTKVKIIESFGLVSYEKLYLTLATIESIEPKRFNIYKLIQLL